MNRRTAIATGAAVVGTALTGAAISEREGDTAPRPPSVESREAVSTGTLHPETERETTYYELGPDSSGPTGLVLGGVHGDETNGVRAAEAMVEWELDHGSLVIVPWTDIKAVQANSREGPDGDLNRQFPVGQTPETALARAVWDLVETVDPDVVLDLHRSRGLLETHHRWVGQAIFPTATGDAVEDASAVVDHVNEHHVPATMRFHQFVRGNTLTGENPMVIHKVGEDHGTPGFLVELTDFLLSLDTQVRWTIAIAEFLLERHGIERQGSERQGSERHGEGQ